MKSNESNSSMTPPYILLTLDDDFDEGIRADEWKKQICRYDILPIITKCDKVRWEKYSNRYKNFLDSNIWFHIYFEDGELKDIETRIEQYVSESRYNLQRAIEYRELYLRLLSNDYLMKQNNGSEEDHADYVCPFLFHSERKSLVDIKKKENKQIIDDIKQYKWRILLVDDHCTDKMKNADGRESTLTKLDIVQTELENLFDKGSVATKKEEITKDTFIYIDCASKLEDAKTALQNKKYEIILLDYLLGGKGDGREYGYELLKGIWAKEENKAEDVKYKDYIFDYKKGPNNRFYFMFISAFTTAVSERLLTEGWHRSEDYWYIGEGACPINTPYLFQYRLLHIMEKRMKEMGLNKLLGINHTDFESSYIKTDIIDVIFAPNDTNVRQSANRHFNNVLSILYNYKNLLVDTHNASNPFDSPESTLATDFVMNNAYIGGFLEHLTQLVYLTAFGTVRQWPEMWEEYQFLKSVVGKRIEPIEKYIFNLKNNSVD